MAADPSGPRDGDAGAAELADDAGRLAAAFATRLRWQQRFGVTGAPLGKLRRSGQPAAAAAPADSVAAPAAPARAPGVAAAQLEAIREDLGDCTRCKLSGGRKNIVYGVGNPDAHLVFVGEGPGANEDAQGEPFVGEAGQLLDKMILAMGYAREDVYIANIIKCRPPGNRNPEPDEIAACEPFLRRQLDAIRPRMIVALGKFAAQTLLGSDAAISSLRGRFHSYQGIQVMPTYHPAYLLRTPSAKRMVWDDLKLVMERLAAVGLVGPRKPAP